MELPDGWTVWIVVATVLLAIGAFVIEWRREEDSQPREVRAPHRPGPRPPEARAAAPAALHMLAGSVLLVLAAALCAYIVAQDSVGPVSTGTDPTVFWTKVDFFALPAAAGVAALPVLWRGRWTFAATVAVPMVLVAWQGTMQMFRQSEFTPPALGLGLAGLALTMLAVNYARFGKGAPLLTGVGVGTRITIIALGGASVLATLGSAVAGPKDYYLGYGPFVIALACIAVQTAWEPEEPARRGAGLVAIVFAPAQAIYPLSLLQTAGPDLWLANVLLLLSLAPLLVAGFVAVFAENRPPDRAGRAPVPPDGSVLPTG